MSRSDRRKLDDIDAIVLTALVAYALFVAGALMFRLLGWV